MADAFQEVREAVGRGSGRYSATELQRLQLVATLAAADEAREANRLAAVIATGIAISVDTSNLLAYAALTAGERSVIPRETRAQFEARLCLPGR